MVLVGPVYPFRGGIAHYTSVLDQELRRSGHDVLLLSFRRQYPRWLFPGRTDRDPSERVVAVADTHYVLDPLCPVTWFQAISEIRAFRPDRVALQWWQAFWAPAWIVLAVAQRLAGIPVTVICHNVLPHERHFWDVPVARLVLGLARRFIVQSDSERGKLRQLLGDVPVDTVPHPLYDMFAQETVDQATARSILGLADGGPVLLFFGFVREYKGLHYLIEALPAVMLAFPHIRLLVAGEFWHNRAQYEQQISSLDLRDRIILVDRYIPNEDVPLYFGAADLVVLPYVTATQSGVVQLALGCSRPIVTTRVGGLAEAVDEGTDLILVEPRSASALATAIIEYLGSSGPSSLGISRERSKQRWGTLVNAITRHE